MHRKNHASLSFAVTLRAAALVGLAALLASAGNAVSPRGIAWAGERVSPVERRAKALGLDTIDTDGVLAITRSGSHLILDARSADAFSAGHLPTAISCPADNAAALAMLQPLMGPGQPVLVYCSGAACDDSLQLAELIAEHELGDVTLYVGGVEAWRAAHLSLEQ